MLVFSWLQLLQALGMNLLLKYDSPKEQVNFYINILQLCYFDPSPSTFNHKLRVYGEREHNPTISSCRTRHLIINFFSVANFLQFAIGMLGYGSNLTQTVVVELKYNYNVTEYTKGNAYEQVSYIEITI